MGRLPFGSSEPQAGRRGNAPASIDLYSEGMNRPEARELQYFVAVAEELHFGRAAERLGIEQPPLSRAISRLERHLGVRLLERTTRSVALTPAGSVLLEESRVALDAIDAATRRAQRAGAEEAVLPVALKSEGDASLLRLVLSAYEREDDAIPIEVVMATWGQEAAMLRDGRAEVALLRTPFDERGLDYEKLLTEPRLVSMHADHRLASRRRLRLADLREASGLVPEEVQGFTRRREAAYAEERQRWAEAVR